MKKKIDVYEYMGEILKGVKSGVLITGKDENKTNSMTISWGMAGIEWGKPVFVTFIRESRFTKTLIDKNGEFTVNIPLDESAKKILAYCGSKSGRDVDKMKDLTLPVDQNNIPYMGYQACAVISGKVLEQQDLGTHTLFIAEVTDAKLLNENAPLTYADYQNRVKPKKKEIPQDKKIVGWRCKICNYVYEGSELPADYICPICGHDVSDFEPIFEN